jgi:hypothetical protein
MTAADPLLIRAVLSLYPRPWRDRYQDEFAGLLGDLLACSPRRARVRLIANAVAGAADARLNIGGGRAMTERIRGSLGVMICALIVFAIAGAGFQKMTEDPAFTAAASKYSSIGTSFNVLRGAAIVAGVIVLAAAAPLVWTVLRQAVTRRQPILLGYLAIPPVAIGAWLGVVKLIMALSAHPRVHSTANLTEVSIVIVLGLAAAALCGWSTLTALRAAELSERLLRVEVLPMIAVVACMVAVTIMDLTWGLALRASDTVLSRSGTGGLLATSLAPSWLIGLIVLAAATVVAGLATARAAGQLRANPAGGTPTAAG